MQFGLDKCATLMIRRGILSGGTIVILPDGEEIQRIEENEEYKYLGVLEADDIKHNDMKEKIQQEYTKRIKKVLKSKLNSGNLFKAINTWGVSLYRYGAGVIEWTKDELRQADRGTRKLTTKYNVMHPRSDTDRLYVHREKGGRGLMSIEDTVRYKANGLKRYTERNDVQLFRTGGKRIKSDSNVSKNEYREKQKIDNYEGRTTKPMNGQHVRDTREQAAEVTWTWMK
jgi:hypothetical protein